MKKDLDINVYLLLAVDRRVSLSEAEEVLDMALTLQKETNGLVCGLDLSGDPSVSNTSQKMHRITASLCGIFCASEIFCPCMP